MATNDTIITNSVFFAFGARNIGTPNCQVMIDGKLAVSAEYVAKNMSNVNLCAYQFTLEDGSVVDISNERLRNTEVFGNTAKIPGVAPSDPSITMISNIM
jgi:hypothetical protein